MLSYTRFFPPLPSRHSSFLATFPVLSLPVPRLLDIWTHTKNASSVAREKGLGNRLRDSLPSLNERGTLHTAQRAGSLSLVVLRPLPRLRALLARSLYVLFLPSFSIFQGTRIARLWRTFLTSSGAFL